MDFRSFYISFLFHFLLLFCLVSCSGCRTNKTVLTKETPVTTCSVIETEKDGIIKFPAKENAEYVLISDFDLEGNVYLIPVGVTIKQKHGVFKNGTLIGSGTKIDANKALFHNVKIKGDWIVPKISTDLFVDLSYDNALRDVVALSSDKVQNTIRIKNGEYKFDLDKKSKIGIAPASNSIVYIEGTLTLKPCGYNAYRIVNVKGKNIHILGDGMIVGDKFDHLGKDGEWGMGVNFTNAVDCSLSNLTIKKCWGDCVYVGGNSSNIRINKCILEDGRRQGISVTSAKRVYIEDCTIKDVEGTKPEFAIDIEPNKNDTVSDVFIKGVNIIDCKGGIKCGCRKDVGSYIGSVIVENCSISGDIKYLDYRFRHAKNLSMKNNTGIHKKIVISEVENVKLENNSISGQKNSIYDISNCRSVKKR